MQNKSCSTVITRWNIFVSGWWTSLYFMLTMFCLCITWRAWVLHWWTFCRLKWSFITTTADATFWNVISRHFLKSDFCLDVTPLPSFQWLVGTTWLLAAWWLCAWMWFSAAFPLCFGWISIIGFLSPSFFLKILLLTPGGNGAHELSSWSISQESLMPWKFWLLWKAPFRRTSVRCMPTPRHVSG